MKKYDIEPLANAHCDTGENPLYDPRRHQVFWTDIPNGRLFRYHLQSGEWEKFYDDQVVGGFTLQENGDLLLFRVHEFALWKESGEVVSLVQNIDATTGRFNDVFTDPEGRVFAGTMGQENSPGSGGLFRVDGDGTVTKLWNDTDCANGSSLTPDLTQMYWTDSTGRIVYRSNYDRATGALSQRRIWKQFEEKDGIPDGMTVDTDGCVWSAFWGASCVRRFSPDGQMMEEIKLPVEKVSSLTFGGADWNELFITTAGGTDDSNGAEGTLYRVRVEAKGKADFRSKICL
jgi:D-xylonolactonase